MKDSTMIVLGVVFVICALCSVGYGYRLRWKDWGKGYFPRALGYQALVVGVVLLLVGLLNGRYEAVHDVCSLFGLSC